MEELFIKAIQGRAVSVCFFNDLSLKQKTLVMDKIHSHTAFLIYCQSLCQSHQYCLNKALAFARRVLTGVVLSSYAAGCIARMSYTCMRCNVHARIFQKKIRQESFQDRLLWPRVWEKQGFPQQHTGLLKAVHFPRNYVGKLTGHASDECRRKRQAERHAEKKRAWKSRLSREL